MTDARTLKHLEKLFAAEINGQDAQIHPRTADRLERLGFIVRDVHTTRDRLGTLTVEFHRLTHLGRFTYCETCEGAATTLKPTEGERATHKGLRTMDEEKIVEVIIEDVIERTFAPAINFKAPYARLMRAKAAKDALSALKEAGYAVTRKVPGIIHDQEPYTGEEDGNDR